MVAAAPVLVFAGDESEFEEEPVHAHARLAPAGDSDEAARRPDELCVLLVEDDPSMRLVCTVNLETDGFRVLVANDGKEGLALAQSERPDIVLLDVMLPDLGGFDVAAQLDLPIVFLSARASELDFERGRRSGALDYVTKPFDPTALPARLREDLDEFFRSGSADGVWRMRFGPGGRRRT
jgi:CheY-like chemotaxis protein